MRSNTLFGNPRDERFSFGACTPVSQHTQPVSHIVVVVQIAEKLSANLVCNRADPAWPSAPSAVADPTKPSRTSRSCSFSDRLTVLSVSFAERKGNRRQGQRRERSACTRSESSLRARDRLTRSKRTYTQIPQVEVIDEGRNSSRRPGYHLRLAVCPTETKLELRSTPPTTTKISSWARTCRREPTAR